MKNQKKQYVKKSYTQKYDKEQEKAIVGDLEESVVTITVTEDTAAEVAAA